MARSGSEHPTELELEILKVLWAEAPLPVRDVRARLKDDAGRELTHSSVITMLNIMYRKGFVRRRKKGNLFLFSPKLDKDFVSQRMMGDLLSRLFDGSTSAMVLQLLETADVDSRELSQLHKLIERKSKETTS